MIAIMAVEGLPEVAEGTNLGAMIAAAADIQPGDIVVVSQKVVSKAERRVRRLADVAVGESAAELAAKLDREPALIELILKESNRIVRATPEVLITETVGGWVCANAGIDSSNMIDEGTVTLLPLDADESARRIRGGLGSPHPAVVIADSFGRPWRLGQADVAIGAAGLTPLDDWRGRGDRAGRELNATVIAVADEVAAAADLARDKLSGTPVVVIRGLERYVTPGDGPGAAALRRAAGDDLFR